MFASADARAGDDVEGAQNGVTKDFGAACYLAVRCEDARTERESCRTACAALSIGMRWPRLVTSSREHATGAELTALGSSPPGAQIKRSAGCSAGLPCCLRLA